MREKPGDVTVQRDTFFMPLLTPDERYQAFCIAVSEGDGLSTGEQLVTRRPVLSGTCSPTASDA